MSSIFGKATALRIGHFALQLVLSAPPAVIQQLSQLSILHRAESDVAQSSVALVKLTCIDWTVLANADPGDESCDCYNLETGIASTFLLPSLPYLFQPSLHALTDVRHPEHYFHYISSPDRPSRAHENSTYINLAEMSESPLPNSFKFLFSSGPSVAALRSVTASKGQRSSPAYLVMASASVSSVRAPAILTIVEHSALVVAPRAIGLQSILAFPSDPNPMDASPAVPFSLGSQVLRVVPPQLLLLAPPEAMATTGVSLSRQLATFKRQNDAARWNSVVVTAVPHMEGGRKRRGALFPGCLS